MSTNITVSWENFRSYAKKTSLELPRITVFIGRNNVGKSSAYAPLLLLKQTLEAQNPATALLTRGKLLDVGLYSDYVNNHEASKKIRFRVDNLLQKEAASYRGDEPHSVEMTFFSQDGMNADLYRHEIRDVVGKPIVRRTRQSLNSFEVQSRLLPSNKGRPHAEVSALRKEMREEEPRGFSFSGFGALLIPSQLREDGDAWAKMKSWYDAAYDVFNLHRAQNFALDSFLRGISYLGPLRSLPQRTYQLGAERPIDVGRDGDKTPEVLFHQQDSEVFTDTNAWLRRLGYGELSFDRIGDDYFQMKTGADRDLSVNVAHSGVGLSQLLPLLVQGLMTPTGGMLIAQQPEIHLNPRQQVEMTDFLIETVNSGRRLLVETHSEHVLLRLRRRIAEGVISPDDVAIYFFDGEPGDCAPRRIPVDRRGQYEKDQWPKDFLAEQLNDSMKMVRAGRAFALKEQARAN